MADAVATCRKAFNAGKTRPLSWRKTQLVNFLRMMNENESMFMVALAQDLRKPVQETVTMEVEYVRNDIRGCLNNIEKWNQDEHVEKNIVTLMDETYLHYDPLGVVLIIGAWNYPVQLQLGSLAGAISAGNCAVLKPSELAPAVADVIAVLLPKYLDPECFKVVVGGIPETTELLKLKFDHIFFTGSTTVGKIIRDAANKHLTPVTLELGGKSPVYICDSANIDISAKRLVWAKFINLGQTCIAPDYILCSQAVQEKFIKKVKVYLNEFYGSDPQKSPDLCRIVNRRNLDRLADILSSTKGNIEVGGSVDAEDLYIEPTLVTGVTAEDSTMASELFGPILPFITVNNMDEAVDFINSRDKPLSLYVFTSKQDVVEKFKVCTSSGSMVVNDAIVHLSVETLPFGGVGPSGMGSYHGKYTFKTFTHQKSILARGTGVVGEYLGETRYPPYSVAKMNRLMFLLKNRKIPDCLGLLPYLACFIVGGATAVLTRLLAKQYDFGDKLPEWF